ncbi:MAG TPA: ATP-binding protein [Acetobacteraceae bacterium]
MPEKIRPENDHMTGRAPVSKSGLPRLLPIGTVLSALTIFIGDTITPQDITFPILYVVVVLLAASFCKPRGVWLTFLACVALTVVSYVVSPHGESQTVGISNTVLAIMAMALTAFLAVRYYAATTAMREQANLIDLTHDPICVLDMNYVITFWNRSAADFYGWSAAEAIGKTYAELWQPTYSVPFDDIMAELLRTGVWEGEIMRRRRDGTLVALASRWSLKQDGQGQPVGILVTSNDITARRQAQEKLREAQEDLARVNRVMLMSELTASIAHEVRQPISAATTSADAARRWLSREPPSIGEATTALGQITRDCLRASEIVNRVSALVRKQAPRKERLGLNEAILDVIAMIDDMLQRNQVMLRTRLARDLPLVTADRVQLQQVVLNLITNAVEAMKTDDPRDLTVRSGLDDENEVFVEVRDSGPGLDPAHLDHLFDSFHTTKPGGMGMGLAISRSIVQAHGGRLWAEPNQPRGATFRFTLPVRAVSSADKVSSPS